MKPTFYYKTKTLRDACPYCGDESSPTSKKTKSYRLGSVKVEIPDTYVFFCPRLSCFVKENRQFIPDPSLKRYEKILQELLKKWGFVLDKLREHEVTLVKGEVKIYLHITKDLSKAEVGEKEDIR